MNKSKNNAREGKKNAGEGKKSQRKSVSKKRLFLALFLAIAIAGLGAALYRMSRGSDRGIARRIWSGYQEGATHGEIKIIKPYDQTVFPPDIIAPVFQWKDVQAACDMWLVSLEFPDGALRYVTRETKWKPESAEWANIREQSQEKKAKVTVLGVNSSASERILSAGGLTFSTSKDPVGAPIFYRSVNLPFADAVRDPSGIQWRFGSISSEEPPPVVMTGLPVCGNCHSFPADGSKLAMEVDSANDKGSYTIAPIEEHISLTKDKIMTWSDYKRDEGDPTFGLLAQISPDGKNVVCMVKDRSVMVPKDESIMFSQLFFPIQGILVNYNMASKTFSALAGADDPEFAQANPSWSPDGKYLVFARAKAYHLKNLEKRPGGGVLLTPEECTEFLREGKGFTYDLYRIPFNAGKGGEPVAVPGASNNGMSNYFAKFSHDGKWIVFCKARNFMLLMPDSELYIMPAEGGEPRRLACNTNRMNSWHSWSPNSKWLVFSSKVNTAYTQLFLTHMDDEGNSTPAVLLENFTGPQRAANIPEFVNASPRAIQRITQDFLDDLTWVRAAGQLYTGGDIAGAEKAVKRALEYNPNSVDGLAKMGAILIVQKKYAEAVACLNKAVGIDPEHYLTRYNLGEALINLGRTREAAEHLRKAIEIDPKSAGAHSNVGLLLQREGKFEEAAAHFEQAIGLDPARAVPHFNLASVMGKMRNPSRAIDEYKEALRLDADHLESRFGLGVTLLALERMDEAIEHLAKAAELAPQNAQVRQKLGVALQEAGKYEQAAAEFSDVVRLVPNNADACFQLAVCLVRKGDIEAGIRFRAAAAEIDPKYDRDPAPLDTFAASLAWSGRFKEAVSFEERALDLARNAGNQSLAAQIERRIALFKEGKDPSGK